MRPADTPGDISGRRPADAAPPRADAGRAAPVSLADAFSVALRAAILTGAVQTGPLHGALRAYVDEMREGGAPPERALVAIKERALIALGRRTDVDRSEASEFLDQIVHWTIQAYFRAD